MPDKERSAFTVATFSFGWKIIPELMISDISKMLIYNDKIFGLKSAL